MSDSPVVREHEAPVTTEVVRQLTQAWWLIMLMGRLSVLAGVIVLAKPSHTLATLTVICGIFVVLDSIFELALTMFAEHGATAALMGIVGIVVGILLIRHPIHGVLAAAFLIGIWLVAIGVLRLVLAFALRAHLWTFVVATVQIVAGVVLVSSPRIGFAALALIVGISLIVNGLASTVLGGSMHGARAVAPDLLASNPSGAV